MDTFVINAEKEYDKALNAASRLIREGGIVAFPTETVYGLGADAFNEEAVGSIFAAKGRPQDNPLIVHIAGSEDLRKLAAEVPEAAKKLMDKFWPGPFTAVLKKRLGVPDAVTAGLDTVAVRMPSNIFARDLIKKSGRMIAAPSANLSGRPSPTSAMHVYEDMNGRIPLIVDGGVCGVGVESTVCSFKNGVPLLLRPGGITVEMIRETAGDVIVHDAVLGELKEERPESPGMKYRHYAPKANVEVICGNKNDVAKTINMRYDNANVHCEIICLDEFIPLYGGRNSVSVGNSYKQAAARLFGLLREADAKGIEKIYFHGLDTDGEGLAVMNRVIRAAGHNVAVVSEEVNFD